MINTTNSASRTLNLNGTFGILSTNQSGVIDMSISDAGAAVIAPYVSGGSSLELKTNASGSGVATRIKINSVGSVMVGGTLQAGTDGGLNVEVTDSGNHRVPLALINQGTADNTGVIISHRGKDDAGNQTDYCYIKMVADDTGNGSEDSSMRLWTIGGGTLGERLRINSDGSIQYRTAGGKGYDFGSSGSSASVANMFAPASYTLAFATNNSERLRIDSSGRVLIGGGSSPSQVGDARLLVYSDSRLHPAIKADCIDGGVNRANGYTIISDNYAGDESQVNLRVS